MSFILQSPTQEQLYINAWNWQVIVELLLEHNILDAHTAERMRYNGTGVKISREQAVRIAAFLDSYLPALPATTKRVLHDLSESDAADDGTLHTQEANLLKNYSASIETIREVSTFCRTHGGFEVL